MVLQEYIGDPHVHLEFGPSSLDWMVLQPDRVSHAARQHRLDFVSVWSHSRMPYKERTALHQTYRDVFPWNAPLEVFPGIEASVFLERARFHVTLMPKKQSIQEDVPSRMDESEFNDFMSQHPDFLALLPHPGVDPGNKPQKRYDIEHMMSNPHIQGVELLNATLLENPEIPLEATADPINSFALLRDVRSQQLTAFGGSDALYTTRSIGTVLTSVRAENISDIAAVLGNPEQVKIICRPDPPLEAKLKTIRGMAPAFDTFVEIRRAIRSVSNFSPPEAPYLSVE